MSEELREMVTDAEVSAEVGSEDNADDAALREQAWNKMQELFQSGESFDVVIRDVVKGGLVADVGVRAFLPASLVDRKFVSDLAEFKGKTLKVKVVEIDPANNKLILSRRAVLEAEHATHLAEVLNQIHEGDILDGTVQRLTNFGAFVDIGGVDGLVHVSELSHSHVNHPSDVVAVGDKVKVCVLRVDPSAGKISLSIKAAQPGPWEQYAANLTVGEIVTGSVKRVTDFGAFIELYPGLEGLVHVSRISSEHVNKPSDVLKPGQEVKVKILSVDSDRKRISLSMKDAVLDGQRKEVKKFVEKQHEVSSGTGATLGDLFGDLFKQNK